MLIVPAAPYVAPELMPNTPSFIDRTVAADGRPALPVLPSWCGPTWATRVEIVEGESDRAVQARLCQIGPEPDRARRLQDALRVGLGQLPIRRHGIADGPRLRVDGGRRCAGHQRTNVDERPGHVGHARQQQLASELGHLATDDLRDAEPHLRVRAQPDADPVFAVLCDTSGDQRDELAVRVRRRLVGRERHLRIDLRRGCGSEDGEPTAAGRLDSHSSEPAIDGEVRVGATAECVRATGIGRPPAARCRPGEQVIRDRAVGSHVNRAPILRAVPPPGSGRPVADGRRSPPSAHRARASACHRHG